MEKQTDINTIIGMAQQGNVQSKQILLSMYKPLLLSHVRRYISCFPSFEDACQTAAMAALECIMTYDATDDKPFVYLLKAHVHHISRTHLNRKRRDDKHFIITVRTVDGTITDLPDIRDDNPSVQPEAVLLAAEESRHICHIFTMLTEEEKYLFTSRYLERRHERDIARSTGWSQAKVSRRLHALRRHILHLLK